MKIKEVIISPEVRKQFYGFGFNHDQTEICDIAIFDHETRKFRTTDMLSGEFVEAKKLDDYSVAVKDYYGNTAYVRLIDHSK
jgi:hypothetical protein